MPTLLPTNEEEISYILEDNSNIVRESDIDSTESVDDSVGDSPDDESTDPTISHQPLSFTAVEPEALGTEGDVGEDPEETPDVNPVVFPEATTTTDVVKTRFFITDYSAANLQQLYTDGGRFYVIYDDDTEDEVLWTEVYQPERTTSTRLQLEADQIGAASNQHFWDDTNGAHVTNNTQDDWITEYAKTNHGALSNPTEQNPWHNILINSYGLLLRMGLIPLSAHSRSGISFYDGLGDSSSHILAFLSSNTIQIGKTNDKHLVITNSGITVYNGDGTVAPLTASNIQAAEAAITNLQSTKADITDLTAATGRITTLETNTADIGTIRANSAKVTNLTAAQLEAANAYISSLTAGSVTASDIIADTGKVHSLTANELSAATAYIAALTTGSVVAADIIADHATVGALDTNYAQVNMANVNNAWIQNGTVKDSAITNAMINSVSANKLTAGTIDASNITVTNLNADNITAGTINGQRIGTGSLSLDKLADDVYTETEVNNIVDGLNDRIDGAIETFTGTVIPTLTNTPASGWTTNAIKDTHIGDVYYVVDSNSDQNGYCYRFTKINNVYSWQLIKDSDVTAALARLTTAEGKIGTIETFDSTVSSFMTNTDQELTSIKSAATTLAGRVTTAEGTLATKVDSSTFSTLSQTVEGHTSSITQLTTETTTLTQAVDTLNTKTSSDSGNIVQFSDSIGFKEIVVHGKSIQNGTPTPETPVEIESIDDLTLVLAGRNSFDVSKLVSVGGWTENNGAYTGTPKQLYQNFTNHMMQISCAANTQYVLSFTQTAHASGSSGNNLNCKFTYSDGTTSSNHYTNSSDTTYAFTSDAEKTVVSILFSYVGNYSMTIEDAQVVTAQEWTATTSYTPYVAPTSVSIPFSNNVVRSLPDGTEDTLTFSYIGPSIREGWGLYNAELVQNTDICTLNGTESWNRGGSFYNGTIGTDRFTYINTMINPSVQRYNSILANKVKGGVNATIWSSPDSHIWEIVHNSTQCHIVFDNETVGIDTSTDTETQRTSKIREWLTENPIDVLYPLATPITHSLGVIELPLSENLNLWASTSPSTTINATWWHVAGRDEKNAIDISNTKDSLDNTISATEMEIPYTEVEYVESDGSQVVRLFNSFNENTGFYVDFEIYNNFVVGSEFVLSSTNRTCPSTNYGWLFGTVESGNKSQIRLGTLTRNSSYVGGELSYGNGSTFNSGLYSGHLYTDGRRQQCSLMNGVYTAPDGTTLNLPRTAFNSTHYMALFCGFVRASTSKHTNMVSAKLYNIKFYDGTTLVSDIVGVVRNSDGAVGLYDKVIDHFYKCETLVPGPVVGDLGERLSIQDYMDSKNPIVEDNRNSDSRVFSGVCSQLLDIADGQQLTYYSHYATASSAQPTFYEDSGSNSNVIIDIQLSNGRHQAAVGLYGGTTKLTTHYGANTMIKLTYKENFWAGTTYYTRAYIADANYTVSNTNTITDKHATSVVAGKNGVKNYSLNMKDDEGNWTSFTTTAGTSTSKVAYTGPFQYDMVLYSSANGNYAAEANTGDGTWYSYTVDMRYSTNVANNATLGLTARQPVYLVGTIANDGYFYLDTTKWWTQTEPTTEDGKTYIYLGYAYSYYQMWLSHDNPKYQYHDGAFTEIQVYRISKNTVKVNEISDTVDEHTQRIGVLETTVESKADGSDLTTVSNTLNTVSQTATSNSQKITNLTTRLGTNADGTAGVNDIIAKESALEQDLNTFKTTVSSTYATQTTVGNISSRVSTAESTIEQHSTSIALKANSSDVYTKTQTDGLISTEVTNRNAAITTATNAINLSVSETYATQTSLASLADDVDALEDDISVLGYNIVVLTTATGIDSNTSSITLTANVYHNGELLNSTAVSQIGTVKWYKGSTLMGTGLTLTASSGGRYTARLEAA